MTTHGNSITGEKKAAAGRKGRGEGAFSDLRTTSKRDPDLQKRIDLVVAMAKAAGSDHSVDVMHVHVMMIRGSLRVTKLG